MQVSEDRLRLEKELKITFTKMVENSRATLKNELALTLKEEDELLTITTQGFIDKDCDSKLLKIPGVIKDMLDHADKNAERISLGLAPIN